MPKPLNPKSSRDFSHHPTIPLSGIEATKMMVDGKGFLLFRLADTSARVIDETTNKEVGEVGGCIGGGVQLTMDGESYYITAQSLWNSFCDALGRPERKMENNKTKKSHEPKSKIGA